MRFPQSSFRIHSKSRTMWFRRLKLVEYALIIMYLGASTRFHSVLQIIETHQSQVFGNTTLRKSINTISGVIIHFHHHKCTDSQTQFFCAHLTLWFVLRIKEHWLVLWRTEDHTQNIIILKGKDVNYSTAQCMLWLHTPRKLGNRLQTVHEQSLSACVFFLSRVVWYKGDNTTQF